MAVLKIMQEAILYNRGVLDVRAADCSAVCAGGDFGASVAHKHLVSCAAMSVVHWGFRGGEQRITAAPLYLYGQLDVAAGLAFSSWVAPVVFLDVAMPLQSLALPPSEFAPAPLAEPLVPPLPLPAFVLLPPEELLPPEPLPELEPELLEDPEPEPLPLLPEL